MRVFLSESDFYSVESQLWFETFEKKNKMWRWPSFIIFSSLKILICTAVSIIKESDNTTAAKCDAPRGFYDNLKACENRCTLADYGCRPSKSLQRCYECVYTSRCYEEFDCDSDCPKGYQCEKVAEKSEFCGPDKPHTCVKAMPDTNHMEHWMLALIVFSIILLTLLVCVPCVICVCLPFLGITYKGDLCPKSCSKIRYHRSREA